MIINAYTLYDRKALTYNPPFFAVADGVAVRMLQELVADQNTSPGRHPNDYVLYCCGAYDDQSGVMHPVTALRHIIDASSVAPRNTPLPFDPQPRPAAGTANGSTVEVDTSGNAEVKFNGSGV